MTRAAKQKLGRKSTAAYAASQPLFDALRLGCESIGEQKQHLAIARDLVQGLHVKVVTNSASENTRHQRYMDSAVKAWRAATDTYSNIFKALADVTAAEPNLGKQEKEGHQDFAEMAETAAEAWTVANEFKLYEDIAREQASHSPEVDMKDAYDEDDFSEEASDSEEEEEGEDVQVQDSNKRARSDDTPQLEHHERSRKIRRVADDTPTATTTTHHNGPSNLPAKNEKLAAKRKKNKSKRDSKIQKKKYGAGNPSHAPYGSTNGVKAASTPNMAVPGVEYQDVSAEVEARLVAKEEARKTAKKQKKRKRDSGDSMSLPAVGVQATEKRTNKKSKTDSTAPMEQSKKHGRGFDDDGVDDGVRRKKKKTRV